MDLNKIWKEAKKRYHITPKSEKLRLKNLAMQYRKQQPNAKFSILKIMKTFESTYKYPTPRLEIIELAKRKGLGPTTVNKILEEMKIKGDIYEPRTGFLQIL